MLFRSLCDRLEAANKRAEKSEFNPRLNMAFPVEWIGQYRNGDCTDPCDMISGPCACGATHHFDEWIIKRKKLVQGKGWVNPEESQEPDAEFVKEMRRIYKDSDIAPAKRLFEACDRIEAAEKNVQIWREACDLEAKGREVAEKELLIMTNNRNHFEKQVEQLTAKLDAEGFRFREQKQISKELQAKLAEANGVIEMLKEKGIG